MTALFKKIIETLGNIQSFTKDITSVNFLQYHQMKPVLVPIKAKRLSRQKKARPQPYL